MSSIHQKIKNQRIKAGLTEDDMAEKLGIPRSTYQYWEQKTPKVDKIRSIAKALSLPEDYFFIENDEKAETDKQSEKESLTIEVLASALADQAKANKDHAEAYKIQAQAYRELLELFKILRTETAREKTQAAMFDEVKEMKSRLGDLWNGLTVVSARQASDREVAFGALSKLRKVDGLDLLSEANKKAASIFEANGVQDNFPAAGR